MKRIVCSLMLLALGAIAVEDGLFDAGELPATWTAVERPGHSIVFVGDIMLWDRTRKYLEAHGLGYPFAATLPLLQSADLTVGNPEGPVAVAAQIVPGRYRYRLPPHVLDGLRQAGIDIVSMANNHVMDCGPQGLLETLAHLEAAGIRAVGAGRDAGFAAAPAIARVGTARVAVVSAVCPETWYPGPPESDGDRIYEQYLHGMERRFSAGPLSPGTVVATPETVAELVRRAACRADLVVAYLHCGIRYQQEPTPRQRELARAAVAAGADLVVGHHAHVWQPVEMIDGVAVFHGIGNFAFGSGNQRATAAIILRVTVTGKRFTAAEVFPLYTRNRDPLVAYQSKVFSGSAATEVLTDFAVESEKLGAAVTIREGRGWLDLP